MTLCLRSLGVADTAAGLVVLVTLLTAALRADASDVESLFENSSIVPASYQSRFDQLEREYVPTDSVIAECQPKHDARTIGEPWYAAGYDGGFLISPLNPEETPFELKFNLQNQVRYIGFARDVRTWTDNAGNVAPVTNRSNFELPRGRAVFSGFALLPDLVYYLSIDYNTVSDRQVNLLRYWAGYRFGREVSLFIGQEKVPGSREWLASSLQTLGPDRSLATTFFRPSLSQGIWATGEPIDGFYYHTMIANGFNTLGTSPQQLNSRMTFANSIWYEPLGAFGAAYSDFEYHDDPVMRVGGSFTYSPNDGQQGSPELPENASIRLSDGTLLTEVGALSPGVSLSAYSVVLGAVDLSFKYRGFSVSGEVYLRDLFNLQGNGPLPRLSVFEFGGFAQVGYYVIPQQFELYSRTSVVSGPFGTGSEYAGGLNWFFLRGKQNLRQTFDVAWINHSPADQNRTDYRAGDTGLLIRSQFQIFF